MKPILWKATFLILPLLCLAKTWASPLLPIPQEDEAENEGEEEAEETDGEEEDEDEEVEQSETTTETAEYESEAEGGGEVEVEEEASSNSTESILLPHEKTKKPFGYSVRFGNVSSIADTTIDDYQNATVIKSKSKSTTTTDNSVKYLTTAKPKKTTTTTLPTVKTRKALSYSVRYRKRLSTTEKSRNDKNTGLSTTIPTISKKPSTKKSFTYSEKFKLSNITAPLIAPVTENENETDFSDTTVNVVGDDEGEDADTTISPDSGVKPSIFRPKYLTTLEPSLNSGESETENGTKSGAKMNVTREYTFLTPDGNNVTIELNGLFGENEIDGQDLDLGKVELLSPEELEEEEALKNIEDAIMEALGLGDYASSTTTAIIAETEASKEPVGSGIADVENTTVINSDGKRFIEFVINGDPENVSDWESIIKQQLLNFELNQFNREDISESDATTIKATTSTTPSTPKTLPPLHYYEIPELVELFSEIDSEETETKAPKPTKPTPPPGPTTTPVPKSLASFVYYPARGVVENVVELLDTRWFNNITKRWECALTNYCPWQTPISFENGLEVDENGLK